MLNACVVLLLAESVTFAVKVINPPLVPVTVVAVERRPFEASVSP